ncbi:MAG: 4-hydroxy-tetrahydrodipicolinate reductase [Sphaerochaetaceae bacterium]|nr:4-hydroxy-tetrahydrodipicolinate reductase [Sphaerochaetaceae bacterium]
MVHIILNGANGRMGKVLANQISNMEEVQVVAGIDTRDDSSTEFPIYRSLNECNVKGDVMIDFSTPDAVNSYIDTAVERKLPIVVATTALGEKEIQALDKASVSIPIFRSANMSLGINLLQQLLQQSQKVLDHSFDIEIIEKHHNMKKDAPSGTAFMLAEAINEVSDPPYEYLYGREGKNCKRKENEMTLHAVRGGSIVGEHSVIFAGTDEVITLTHTAYSRSVFANGAISAAKFISGIAPGYYSMKDLIEAKIN